MQPLFLRALLSFGPFTLPFPRCETHDAKRTTRKAVNAKRTTKHARRNSTTKKQTRDTQISSTNFLREKSVHPNSSKITILAKSQARNSSKITILAKFQCKRATTKHYTTRSISSYLQYLFPTCTTLVEYKCGYGR
jgi:hypothetical protein